MIAAAALACFPFVANSATFMDLPGFGDTNFVGGGFEAKEVAVGEIRLGNNGLSGDRELGINTPPPATPKASGQFSFVSGTPYAFDFGYDAGSGLLSLSLGATTISTTYFTNIGACRHHLPADGIERRRR